MDTNNDSNIANNVPGDMIEENRMGLKYSNPNLFAADQLIDKMGDNLAKAEAMDDEHPLWTEKTAELQANDDENE